MATTKKPTKAQTKRLTSKHGGAAEVLVLPGVVVPDNVADGRSYRVDRGQVDRALVRAVLVGRADLDNFNVERFDALMRVLVTLRIEAFDLPFDVFDGATCAAVRKWLKAVRPSEMARAIIGAGRDPWAKKKKPTLSAILARASAYFVLADDKAPPPPRDRVDVIAEYIRVHAVAYEIDWSTPWPKPLDAERHTVPILELHIAAMKKAITESRLPAEVKASVLGNG